MKRLSCLILASATLLCGCGSTPRDPYDYASLPEGMVVMSEDYIDFYAKSSYYATFILPFDKRHTDGSRITFDDLVIPYHYGCYSSRYVLFITYLDPENKAGKVSEGGREESVFSYHNINISFLGDNGFPFVWNMDPQDSHRPDEPFVGCGEVGGCGATQVRNDFYEFEEAVKRNLVTDEDLDKLAKSASEIREDPSLWSWSRD